MLASRLRKSQVRVALGSHTMKPNRRRGLWLLPLLVLLPAVGAAQSFPPGAERQTERQRAGREYACIVSSRCSRRIGFPLCGGARYRAPAPRCSAAPDTS